MNPHFDFTEEDSEEFIASFKTVTDGPMSDVAAALRSLAAPPALSAKAKPPVLPSHISLKPSNKFKFFGGGVVTGIATIGAAAGLALGAAAVTGNMPPVISETAKKVVTVISNVFTTDPVDSAPQTPQSEETVESKEAVNQTQPDVPAPSQSAPAQQQPVVVEKNDQIVTPAPAAAPVAPAKPAQTPLAQISPPAVSAEGKEESEKEDEKKSESSESTEKKKSETAQLSPITSTQGSSEKKESENKESEKKGSETKSEEKKEEKDDK